MRKRISTVILAVLILFVGGLTASAKGAKPGYVINNYKAITIPSIDGSWSPTDEWADAAEAELDGNLTVYFRLKWQHVNGTTFLYIIIDFVNDTTSDGGDEWGVYVDAHHNGGTQPSPDDYYIRLSGHSSIRVEKGTGSGWAAITNYTLGVDFSIVDNLGSSPHSSTSHWICEVKLNVTYFDLLNNFCIRIAAYDASSSAGNQCWPDSAGWVPDDWGQTITMWDNIPEFSSAIALMTLLAASLLQVCLYRRKSALPC